MKMVKPILRAAWSLSVRLTSLVNHGLLKRASALLDQAQGFGFGAATTHLEARVAANLLSNFDGANRVVFDIGANRGEWSLSISKNLRGAAILAFEPSVGTFELLMENTRDFNICIHNFGFSNKSGRNTLFYDKKGSGLASLTKRRVGHFGIAMELKEEITLTTLNEFVAKTKKVPNLIKIDVEGHELDVLQGASNIINEVQVIQFEFGGCNLDTKSSFQDFWYFFSERDFTLYRLTPTGLIKILQYDETLENYQTTNYFAVNNSKPH